MNNKRNGTKFENEICEMASKAGLWARPMFPAPNGSQPFDVMLINQKGNLLAIECKVCVNDVFDLRRIEDNQRVCLTNLCYSFNLLNRCFFAFKTSKGIYMIEAKKIIDMSIDALFSKTKKSLDLKQFESLGINWEQFIKQFS